MAKVAHAAVPKAAQKLEQCPWLAPGLFLVVNENAAWAALPPLVGGVDWQVDVRVQRDGESGNMAVAP